MKKYVWHDGEGSSDVQHRPGHLGMSWDRELSSNGPLLEPLTTFPWSEYQELLDLVGSARSLIVAFPSGTRSVEVAAYDDVAVLLAQVPGIDACREDGPPDNPASGCGYDFFLAERAAAGDVAANVVALVAVLQADLDLLRALHPDDDG